MLASRALSRPAVLVGALFIVFAPGSPLPGQTLPQGLPGRYTLVDIEGHALPYAPTEPGRPANAPSLEVLASTLILRSDGQFVMAMAYRVRQGGTEHFLANPFTGTIVPNTNGYVMRWEGAGETSATWEAERFTFTNEGQTFTYRRQSPPRAGGN